MIPEIVQHEHVEMVMMQLELIPYLVKDPKKSIHPINAKAETLAEKPMFRRHTKNLERTKMRLKKGGANPILPESIIIYNHWEDDHLMYHLLNPGAIRPGQVHTALTKRQLFFIR